MGLTKPKKGEKGSRLRCSSEEDTGIRAALNDEPFRDKSADSPR